MRRGRPAGAFVDLHATRRRRSTRWPRRQSLVRTAATRGLTHLAITDHDRIDGALAAQAIRGRDGLGVTVIVGEEIKTPDGDLDRACS